MSQPWSDKAISPLPRRAGCAIPFPAQRFKAVRYTHLFATPPAAFVHDVQHRQEDFVDRHALLVLKVLRDSPMPRIGKVAIVLSMHHTPLSCIAASFDPRSAISSENQGSN